MEESLDDLVCDRKAALTIIPDLSVLEQNQREIEKINQNLLNLKARIGGRGKV